MWRSILALLCICYVKVAFAANITTGEGVKLINGNERLLIQPWGTNAIRIRSSVYSDPTGDELGAVLDPPDGQTETIGQTVPTMITYNDTALISNGHLIVNVTKSRLSFWRTSNQNATLLFQESWPTHGYQARARSFVSAGATSQGSARFAFTLDPEEQVFGFGQHQHGVLNNKGETYDFRGFESEITVPSFISSKSYGFIWNVPALGSVSINKREVIWTADSARVIDYSFVIAAEPGDFASILDTHTAVTGRPAVMPKAARGFIQSKNRYASQAEVMAVADGFAQRRVNVSMIVIDAHHWIYFGDWSFNRTAFPNPAGMASYVRNSTGSELMVSVWPLVQSQSPHWLNMSMLGLLTGASEGAGWIDYQSTLEAMQEIDPFNGDTRQYVWQLLKQNYADYGIKNFWLDSNEGAELGDGYFFKDSNTVPLQAVPFARPNLFYAAGSASEVNPLFGYYEQKLIEDGTESIGSETESISLTRSFWLGSQRFRSTPWNGDVDSSWEAFPLQVTAGLNTQLSGITYWNTDVGGYYSGSSYFGNISDPIYKELAVRWYQYGTFSPIFRAHGTRTCAPSDENQFGSCPNEFWTYGNTTGSILQQYITLRYTLASYISSAMAIATRRGTPLQRPLFFDFAVSDPWTLAHAEDIKLQFMFGPRLLIAPVTTFGSRSLRVYLPQTANGTGWRSWWTDESTKGGQWVNASAPLNQVPVFYLGTKSEILSGHI